MADQTFANEMRERAEDCRHPIGPGVRLGVPLDPDEADAIADALEAADKAPCICPPSWDNPDTGERVRGEPELWCNLHVALDRLNRVAVKSAESQPES